MSIPTPLPEVLIAGVCFVVFVFLLVKALCEAARGADDRLEREAEQIVAAEVRELERVLSLPARKPVRR